MKNNTDKEITSYIRKGNTIPDKEIMKNVLTVLKISTVMLAESIDEKKGNIYQITMGRNGISKRMANKIVTHFPQISIDYLLHGIGDPKVSINHFKSDMPSHNIQEETYKEVVFLNLKVAQLQNEIKELKEILMMTNK